MKFIGIDLGWVSGPTGLSCLIWKHHQLQVLALTTKTEFASIFTWIDNFIPENEPGIIAVDAPTIIPNQTGTRLPDQLTHKYFGRYHAGCYPANLNRPFAQRTIDFGKKLEKKGFVHAPQIEPQKLNRYQIEVYPHPAIVNLFSLQKILKYKKGKLETRRLELNKLYNYMATILPKLTPSLDLSLVGNNLISLSILSQKLTGKEFKHIEDQLDSIICAYIAAYWWYWGLEKNLVLGDETTGYIIVPNCIN